MLRPAGLPSALAAREDTLVMGILNVTPDSFSDGGEHAGRDEAIAHARLLLDQGADIIDVGGESTRPGAARVSAEEELARVLPVVEALAADGICVSVDTMRAQVARETVARGAIIVNDVSAGLADEQMASTVAGLRTREGSQPVYVAMHWRGHSDVMGSLTQYDDVARDVAAELGARVQELLAAGIARDHLVADPGLGFSKAGGQDWELLARRGPLEALELPVLIGASRKRFVAALGQDRDQATAAISAIAALHGAWCVRVHDVAPTKAAVAVAAAIRRHGGEDA